MTQSADISRIEGTRARTHAHTQTHIPPTPSHIAPPPPTHTHIRTPPHTHTHRVTHIHTYLYLSIYRYLNLKQNKTKQKHRAALGITVLKLRHFFLRSWKYFSTYAFTYLIFPFIVCQFPLNRPFCCIVLRVLAD